MCVSDVLLGPTPLPVLPRMRCPKIPHGKSSLVTQLSPDIRVEVPGLPPTAANLSPSVRRGWGEEWRGGPGRTPLGLWPAPRDTAPPRAPSRQRAQSGAKRQPLIWGAGEHFQSPIPKLPPTLDPQARRAANQGRGGDREREREVSVQEGLADSFHPQRPPLVHAIPGATRCPKLSRARKVNRGAGARCLLAAIPLLGPSPGPRDSPHWTARRSS